MIPGAKSAKTVGIGISLGIVAIVLMYDHGVGLGAFLYLIAWLGLLFVHARSQEKAPILRNLLLLIPTVFFGLMMVIRSDRDLLTINALTGSFALMLLACFFTKGNVAFQSLLDYPTKALFGAVNVILQPVEELKASIKWVSSQRNSWRGLAPYLRGAAITIPLVAVFVILLSSADEIFGRMVNSLFSGISWQNLPNTITQVGFGGLFAWIAIGVLTTSLLDRIAAERVAPPSASPTSDATPDDPPDTLAPAPPLPTTRPITLGFTETTMALGGVLTVFAAFVVIQFVYLFGGVKNIANFSYAEYVHRGFAELVIVAVLVLGLVFVLDIITVRGMPRKENIFRGLGTMLIALTMVILVSAFQRLRLYELTYGFTALRLTIYVSILWLGVLFVGMVVSLYWKPSTVKVFETTALITVFGFVATLDVLNPDAFVAWQNINRGDVDPVYLSSLSVEAVPALVTLIDAPEPGLRVIIRQTLAERLYELRWYRERDWRDFSLGSSNAVVALDGVKDKLANLPLDDRPGNKLDDFKTGMRTGMSVRAAYRQFGYPYATYNAGQYDYDLGGQLSTDSFRLVYRLTDQRQVSLEFDATLGLTRATVCETKTSNPCLYVPILPQP